MSGALTGRVCIVTGGSRGLGLEMALELAGQGASVCVTGAAASPALEAAGEACRALGAPALALPCDVADFAACEALAARVEAELGPVDVLVNNAGIGMRAISETFNTVPTRFWEADPQAWGRIVQANLTGAFNMARAVVPGMVARGSGKVINVSTSDQTMVRRGYSPYGPSKAGLEAASRVWAQDLEGTGVSVNVYLPGGAADTDLLPPSADKKGADGNLLPAAIMRRAIGWLAGPGSDGVNGGRYIARLWDERLPPAEAAAAAASPHVDKPAIM
ncbi:SDR family NAD(P)-dependent oxidoreductase [Albimonas pacifica]|uniref:3-oxoacyl-[acyl-carrier protein] reductase n=1 Tax=Albimonas pacifica TaxID=1114924 RepID=A0A1I3H4F7_9RHOB|nr:SDR family oxidoreductase [Albimonas pacifica]SFI30668.1 3-oxoacyl-[acyl-carrier protein] reductase [Albimonas pacifica]